VPWHRAASRCLRSAERAQGTNAFFLDFFLVGAGLPPRIAGSIHPPVTTGHGDEVVLNFLCPAEHVGSEQNLGLEAGRGSGADGNSFGVHEQPQNGVRMHELK
jgi:hypothetical protein